MRRGLWCVLLLAGCGNGETAMDMSISDLSVEGDLLPLDAGFLHQCPMVQLASTIHVTGTVKDLGGVPAAGIQVSFYNAAGDLLLANAVYNSSDSGVTTGTDTDGYFEFDAATDGNEFEGYFLFTGANVPTTRWYLPIRGSFGASVGIATHDQLALGYTAGGIAAESGKGLVFAQLANCADKRLAGATATFLPPAGAVRYTDGTNPLPSMTASSTGKDGVIFGVNLPAGPATVTAIVGAQEIVSPTFTVVADGVTIVSFNP